MSYPPTEVCLGEFFQYNFRILRLTYSWNVCFICLFSPFLLYMTVSLPQPLRQVRALDKLAGAVHPVLSRPVYPPCQLTDTVQ